MLNRDMLDEEIEDDFDPEILKGDAYDQNLLNMQEELLGALNKRKSKILEITLKIFNKV